MISGLPRYLQNVAIVCALGLSVTITACATTSGTVPVETDATNIRTDMIDDLLSVLPQLLDPSVTSIQYSDTESGNISNAVNILAEHGYGLQRVDADQGSEFITIIELPLAEYANIDETRMRVSVGSLELTRSYRVIDNKSLIDDSENIVWRNGSAAIPSGPLLVAGTQQPLEHTGVGIQFTSAVSTDITDGKFKYTERAKLKGGIPTISLITEDIVRSITDAAAIPVLANINRNQSSSTNLYNGGVSDFRPFLEDYNRIIREFVIFPNDSQNLGRSGKSLVKAFLDRYSKTTDVIGIIGCSNGPTGLAIGNEGLAVGRAKRIVQELTVSGVEAKNIFDEGCWSSTVEAQGFPNRGVVLDLYRRAG